jgi:hypothetical protein
MQLSNHLQASKMAGAPPLKSILKNTASSPQTPSKEERDRETALYHANLIQERKDIELQILYAQEDLIEFPLDRGPQYSASSPSPSDITLFKKAIQPFQPNDYDDLIVERNINEHCGYTLCPLPRLKEEGMGRGQFRLLGKHGKAKDFRVVEKSELEKWCSEDCARRALYVRVQLSERPGWERTAVDIRIDLLDEPKTELEREQERLEEDLSKLKLENAKATSEGRETLAFERGDRGARAASGLVEVAIKEKQETTAPTAPSFDLDDLDGRLATTHLTLDGHTPKFGSRRELRRQEDDNRDEDASEEESGMDWEL